MRDYPLTLIIKLFILNLHSKRNNKNGKKLKILFLLIKSNFRTNIKGTTKLLMKVKMLQKNYQTNFILQLKNIILLLKLAHGIGKIKSLKILLVTLLMIDNYLMLYTEKSKQRNLDERFTMLLTLLKKRMDKMKMLKL